MMFSSLENAALIQVEQPWRNVPRERAGRRWRWIAGHRYIDPDPR